LFFLRDPRVKLLFVSGLCRARTSAQANREASPTLSDSQFLLYFFQLDALGFRGGEENDKNWMISMIEKKANGYPLEATVNDGNGSASTVVRSHPAKLAAKCRGVSASCPAGNHRRNVVSWSRNCLDWRAQPARTKHIGTEYSTKGESFQ
jgi:hypothetical protein